MKLPDQSDETVRTAKHVHYLAQAIRAGSVKGLGQVPKGDAEAEILFLTLFLQLPCSKYLITVPQP